VGKKNSKFKRKNVAKKQTNTVQYIDTFMKDLNVKEDIFKTRFRWLL